MSTLDSRPTVLLLSSNRRRRYAEDVLTALALPVGAVIQFRYGADYVAASLQQMVANKSIIGSRALIAFVAEADTPEPFLLPVRFATVAQAECIADIFVFKLRVEAYASLDEYPASATELRRDSRKMLDKILELNSKTFFPALSKFPDLHVSSQGDSAQAWLGIAQRLSQHQTFAASYFVRIDAPVRQAGRALEFDTQGRLSLTDQQSAKLPISFFSQEYSEGTKKLLTCVTDGTFVRVSSDDTYDVALRYDTVEFWLQPSTKAFDALARVTVRLGQEPDTPDASPATMARFPVLVKRSRSRLAARIAVSAVGAFLIALPAILGDDTPLTLRVVTAMLGAALLASSTILVGHVSG